MKITHDVVFLFVKWVQFYLENVKELNLYFVLRYILRVKVRFKYKELMCFASFCF